MAIQTVTNANLAAFVAERTTKGSSIATGEQLVEAASKAAQAGKPVEGSGPTPGHPVITSGAETLPNASPDPGNPTPNAKPKPVQDRIDELTRLRKEAEEFAEEEYGARLRAESRIGELENQLKTLTPAPAAPKQEELKRPSPKDFTDQDAYDQAMEAYDNARDERVRQQAIEQGRQEARNETQAKLMTQRIELAKQDLPDYVEVLEAASKRTTVVPPHIRAAFMELDFGPQVAYELAKDAALEKRIFSLSPARALAELGKIETKYAKAADGSPTPAATPTPETTRAPAPLQSVRSTGDGDVTNDLSKERDFQKYKAARMEDIRKRNRRH